MAKQASSGPPHDPHQPPPSPPSLLREEVVPTSWSSGRGLAVWQRGGVRDLHGGGPCTVKGMSDGGGDMVLVSSRADNVTAAVAPHGRRPGGALGTGWRGPCLSSYRSTSIGQPHERLRAGADHYRVHGFFPRLAYLCLPSPLLLVRRLRQPCTSPTDLAHTTTSAHKVDLALLHPAAHIAVVMASAGASSPINDGYDHH